MHMLDSQPSLSNVEISTDQDQEHNSADSLITIDDRTMKTLPITN